MATTPQKFLDKAGVKQVLKAAQEWDKANALSPWATDFLKRQEEAERLSKLTASLALSPAGTEYTGAAIEYTLTASAKYDGKAVTPAVVGTTANISSATFTNGVAKYAYTPPATSTGKETVNFTVKCTYTDELGKVEKTASASQTRYAPIKFLSSAAQPTGAAIAAATQKQVKSAIKDDYSIAFTKGDYVWVCIPAFLTATKFTSGGFGVPMEAPVTIPMTIGSSTVNYKCYRTTGAPQTSPMSLSIE